MENIFTDLMSKKTNDELIQLVTTDYDKYQPLAVETAKNEIKLRNIDIKKIEQLNEIHKEEVAIENLKKTQRQKDVLKNIANSTLRSINFIIDIVAIFLIYRSTAYVIQKLLNIISIREILFLNRTTVFIVFILYFILAENMFQKTLGKIITKTKVVNLDGEKPNFVDITIRTFSRLIPFDGISYLYSISGFHDKLSKTIVIKDTE
ncbi:RDD family protein [Flavobacterium psychrophilum]